MRTPYEMGPRRPLATGPAPLKRIHRFRLLIGLTIVVLMGLLSVAPLAAGGWHGGFSFKFGKPLRVMTRNLYVGTDLFAVLDACAADKRPGGIPAEFWPILCISYQVSEAFKTIQYTDFATRAEAIADEIERYRPDLIGLQEVYRVCLQSPSDFAGHPSPNATDEAYDYLGLLLDALRSRGLQYEAVAEVEGIDLEFPMQAGPSLDDVRITDRDVILARKNVKVLEVDSGTYAHHFFLEFAGLPLAFKRGFCSVKARVRGTTYRFVNTHLEVRDFWVPDSEMGILPVQRLQAQELMAALANETLPIVLVGDFNSDPNDDAEVYAYPVMGDAGFVDVWNRRWWHSDPGLTCCRHELLDDPEFELYERIDLVFVRNDLGLLDFSLIGPVQVQVVGADAIADVPPLYASDHAGVFARLKLPVLRWRRGGRH